MVEKLKDLQENRFLRDCKGNPQWIALVLFIHKPGNNKWRLVRDYRWLNSQLTGKNFPLPVIEDQLDNHRGNLLFILSDLEEGFDQMHLKEDSKHLLSSARHLECLNGISCQWE